MIWLFRRMIDVVLPMVLVALPIIWTKISTGDWPDSKNFGISMMVASALVLISAVPKPELPTKMKHMQAVSRPIHWLLYGIIGLGVVVLLAAYIMFMVNSGEISTGTASWWKFGIEVYCITLAANLALEHWSWITEIRKQSLRERS